MFVQKLRSLVQRTMYNLLGKTHLTFEQHEGVVMDLPSSQASLYRCESGGRAREEGKGKGRETSGRFCSQDGEIFNGG